LRCAQAGPDTHVKLKKKKGATDGSAQVERKKKD